VCSSDLSTVVYLSINRIRVEFVVELFEIKRLKRS